MKKSICLLVAGVSLSGLCGVAEVSQPAVLLKVCTYAGADEYRVMNADEYRAYDKKAKDEVRLFRKALLMTEAAWKANQETAKTPFPGSAIKEKQVKLLGRFRDAGTAEAKMAKLEEQESDSEMKRQDKEKERRQRDMRSVRGDQRSSFERKMKEQESREREKEDLKLQAVALFEEQLEKLISSQTAGPGGAKPVVEEEAAPDAEAKPEPKKAGAAKDLPANR